MLSDYQIISFKRFLKVILVVSMLIFSPAYALENNIYQSNVDLNQSDTINPRTKEQQSSTITSCAAYFKETVGANNCRAGEVPLPAASWLFLLALIGFVVLSNKRKI